LPAFHPTSFVLFSGPYGPYEIPLKIKCSPVETERRPGSQDCATSTVARTSVPIVHSMAPPSRVKAFGKSAMGSVGS
jgi:hypothetical protein